MGYRSEVAALVYPATELSKTERTEKYELLKTLMNITYKYVWEEWDNCFELIDERNVLKFCCPDVKWYEAYPEVKAFDAFMQEIEELGYDTEFVRVGENYDDIETKYSDGAEYHLSVRREIDSEV